METTLWHFRCSHFNEKVRWALDHKRWPHRRADLIPGFHVPTTRALSGQMSTPIVAFADEIHIGSAHIIDELEARRPEPALLPVEPAARQRVRTRQAWFDAVAGPAAARLYWDAYLRHPSDCAAMATEGSTRGARWAYRAAMPLLRPVIEHRYGISSGGIERAHADVRRSFDEIERLRRGGDYIVGETFTLADLVAAALLSPIVLPSQHPYLAGRDLPERMAALHQRYADHPGFAWVERIYARHRPESAAT